jgi:hypothetical protein
MKKRERKTIVKMERKRRTNEQMFGFGIKERGGVGRGGGI